LAHLVSPLQVMLFANACVTTVPFPFLPFMVKGFGYTEDQVGVHVGYVASARFVGNLLTAWGWGFLSDKYGRRPTILFSVGSQVGCCLWFAYTTSIDIKWAVAARFVGGLLNGSVPIVKSYVCEVTDDTNQAKALALVMSAWQTGLMFGPAIGGFLINPADSYPTFDTPAMRAYPYALPMIICAGVLLSCSNRILHSREDAVGKSHDCWGSSQHACDLII
jgi:MFS family permease